VLVRQGERAEAEAAFLQAIDRARAQDALSLELRAALDLYELLAGEGRAEDGRARLAALIGRFTQGLDRPEPARALAIVRAGS
jgi:predicted ATPase